MPCCTECGHENPEDSRFCANCGAALGRPASAPTGRDLDHHDAPAAFEPERAGRRSERTVHRRPGRRRRAAARAPRCSWSSAARTPAAASCSTRDVTTAGRHPDSDIFLDDVTVSRRHAEFRADRTAASRSATSAASTAPTSTGSGSTRPRCAAATRCRSASTGWCSTRAPAVSPAARGDRARLPAATRSHAQHRRGAGAAARRVPRRHDLQDPLPRVRGSGRAGAHAVRLPQVLPRRRRAAALRPRRRSATTTCR